MPISTSADLFNLIKSLSKADKRNFKLYAKRIQQDENMKFIQLFDALDKMNVMDEQKLLEKLDHIDKGQLSNLKRHLYTQILTSLRLINIRRIKAIEVREHINYADILYAKGLFMQSLKILQRAKRLASEAELELLVLEIIEFQKKIESRHLTNTGPDRNAILTKEAVKGLEKVSSQVTLSNIGLKLHGYYIKNSHVKNEEERERAKAFLNMHLPRIATHRLSNKEKILYHQSLVWHYYVLLEFEECLKAAQEWVEVFEDNPELKLTDTVLFMRGYHYLLTAAYNLRNKELLKEKYAELQSFRKKNYAKFNENTKMFSFIYVHWARLNIHFLEGTFQEGVNDMPSTLRRIKRWKSRIAPHRIMLFHYKMAWMHLGNGNPGKAIDYLNNIINEDNTNYREDIQMYSRLLFLMAHYDLNNTDIMEYLVNTVETFYKRLSFSNKLQKRTIQFFKQVAQVGISERYDVLHAFDHDLAELAQDPFEQRGLIYLEINTWVKARLTKKSMGEVIKARYDQRATISTPSSQ